MCFTHFQVYWGMNMLGFLNAVEYVADPSYTQKDFGLI